MYVCLNEQLQCNHPIFCQGPVLETIQLSYLLPDCKTFVDMPLRFEPQIVLANFNKLPDHSNDTLKKFLSENFFDAYSDVQIVIPQDFKENPAFLNQIKNIKIKQFGSGVNQIWKTLVKQFNHSFSCEDCFTSIISSRPFVVPGGRFNEYYYWDNLFILHGLIVSEMYDTSLDLMHNILENIDKWGFMPNGARIYYINRSQPPVASIMVRILYEHLIYIEQYKQKAQELLNYSFTILEKEYQFFMKFRSKEIKISNISYFVNFYDSTLIAPRPESFRQDYEQHLQNPDRNKEDLYQNIAAAAESGWDFSSRWFQDRTNFGQINTTNIYPVDLNSILYLFESNMENFSQILQQSDKQVYYHSQKVSREYVLQTIFYQPDQGWWIDIQKDPAFKLLESFYPSNYSPLWALTDSLSFHQLDKVLDNLNTQIYYFPGGLPSSLKNSGQQWDYPNVWPPSQFIIIEGLWKQPQNKKAQLLAFKLASNYFNNAYCGWLNSIVKYGEGYMFEKYDCFKIGQSGGGGEYEVQTGFGWSNGVLLKILEKYGDVLEEPICPPLL